MVENMERQPTREAARDGGKPPLTSEVVQLPSGWTVDEYEAGPFGFSNVDGIDATLVSPDGSLRLSAYPVSFERQGGREMFSGVTLDSIVPEKRDSRAGTPEVKPLTAFALGAYYEVGGERNYLTYSILADGYDPLIVACWLAKAVGSGEQFDQFYREERDLTTPAVEVEPTAESPSRDGVAVKIPLRYVGYITDWPTYEAGIPAIPPTAGYLTTTVPDAVADENGHEPGDSVGFPLVRDGDTDFNVGKPPEFIRELTADDVQLESLADAPQSFL
jgi:hypothetical protein